ncbi:MAG: alpha-ribazole phosphatase [Syntrophales bacterium]
MARKLLLLRHGDIGKQYQDRYIGSADVSMSPLGHQQVRAIRALLGKERPSQCISSPMMRCRETAAVVMETADMDFTVDPDLREIDFGRWEGMDFGEIQKAFPEEIDRWAEFKADFAFPGGDKIGDFQERVVSVAERLATNPADTILICTHGGVIRLLICHFLGLQPWHYILFKVKHASLATIELFNGSGILAGLNETGQVE